MMAVGGRASTIGGPAGPVGGSGPVRSPEEWKRLGTEAYQAGRWRDAARCYSSAIDQCTHNSELRATCLNNRAACHVQLQEHSLVVQDASEVIKQQPANAKALLRRMVARERLGQLDQALEDAAAVLTMEPKHPQALQVVARKRQSLSKKVSADDSRVTTLRHREEARAQPICVLLFSEDKPLQCYSCLRSLLQHVRDVP